MNPDLVKGMGHFDENGVNNGIDPTNLVRIDQKCKLGENNKFEIGENH